MDAVRIMLQLLNRCLAHYTVITSRKEFKIFAKTLLKHVIKKSITCVMVYDFFPILPGL